MSPSESNSVRNGVVATVVGGIALAILGEMWPPFKGAMAWLWENAQASAEFFGKNYSVPGWVLTILGVLALITVVRTIVRFRITSATPDSSYVEDMLFGAKWRWSWAGGDISNLWCFCPACDGELVYDDSRAHSIYSRNEPQTIFICEHCNRSIKGRIEGGDKEYALGAVRREIHRKIRTSQHVGSQDAC